MVQMKIGISFNFKDVKRIGQNGTACNPAWNAFILAVSIKDAIMDFVNMNSF